MIDLKIPDRAAILAVGMTVAVLSSVLSGCGLLQKSTDDPGAVTVILDHTVDSDPLLFNDIRYTNAAGNRYSVTLLEYIVTDVVLERPDGSSFEIAAVHYRNAEAASTQSFSARGVPGGNYLALSFTFGVAGPKNLTGALPNTGDYNTMAWPEQMGGGYHYMRLEGRYQAADGVRSFLAHTGPTMGNDNSVRVSLPVDIHVNENTWEVQILMDVNEWLSNPGTYDFTEYTGMIMGNQNAQGVLRANGPTVFSIGSARENGL